MSSRRDEIGRSIREDGIVCCTIGDEQYALRSADVRHIARAEQMQSESGTNARVGTIRVGDELVPVFALGRVLRRPGTPGAGTGHHIAVTGGHGALVGWLVDRIVRAPIPDDTAVVALPPVVGTPATTWFDALIAIGDDSVLLLSPALLNPQTTPVERPDGGDVFVPAAAASAAPEPMVVIFSTPALRLAPGALAQDRRSGHTAHGDPSRVTRYALSGRQIAAIVQPLPVIGLPGSARHITGVAWWRQSIVPVMDFRNGAGRHAPCPRWIIAQAGHRPGENLIALPIDADVRLHRASADDRPVAGAHRPALTRGVFGVNDEAVALLDLEALLALRGDAEHRALA